MHGKATVRANREGHERLVGRRIVEGKRMKAQGHFQVNKLCRCRQVVPVPTVGTCHLIRYLLRKALVLLFASFGPLIAQGA